MKYHLFAAIKMKLLLLLAMTVIVIVIVFMTGYDLTQENSPVVQNNKSAWALLVLLAIFLCVMFAILWRLATDVFCADITYSEVINALGGIRALNTILAERAAKLDDTFKRERVVIVAMSSDSLESGEVRFNELKSLVSDAKRNFWDFHHLVKIIGFEVKNSYKDYLPPAMPNIAMSGM